MFSKVDFPDPVRPMTSARSPSGMVRSTFETTGRPDCAWVNVTSAKRIMPSSKEPVAVG